MPGTTDLRRLRFFVELAGDPHFGRTAKRLHISQPAFSQQLRRLEGELGITLFERTVRGAALTPEGARLLPLARDLLARADRFNATARELAGDATAPARRVRSAVPGASGSPAR
ncbi:LysR family transcriptional regulator [Patulibacter sp. SYSU D01012]|uniref:LysR family transcriptional regulator n=1 Tax=Patulibacter sp. SYSU D01012 TaxID=2817381 RepID=UPI001B30B5C4|nr:LysR family transcriptional regulator [Patulibacter sp. SYSU D01012]